MDRVDWADLLAFCDLCRALGLPPQRVLAGLFPLEPLDRRRLTATAQALRSAYTSGVCDCSELVRTRGESGRQEALRRCV